MDRLATYIEIRQRIWSICDELGVPDGELIVPGCPDWTVKDLLAHLTGICADGIAGRMEGVTQDWWTQRQVDERAERSLAEVLAEWRGIGPLFEAGLAGAKTIPAPLILDAWTHEQDLRGALDLIDPERALRRETERTLAGWVVGSIVGGAKSAGLEPVEVVFLPYVVAPSSIGARLHIEAAEYLRGAFGRRSRAQLAAWPWTGVDDPDPYIDALTIFGVAATDINEPHLSQPRA